MTQRSRRSPSRTARSPAQAAKGAHAAPPRRRRWKLNPFARRWLRSPNLGEDPWGQEEVAASGYDWEEWFPRMAAQGKLIDAGGVWVDRYLLTAHFQCVPDRCMPRPGRGRARCCCADLECALSHSEARRLRRHTRALWDYMHVRETRLIQHCAPPGQGERPFWLDEEEENLNRPDDRCVFSEITPDGALRCRLYAFSEETGIPRREVQPMPCRLFPLVLLDMEDGRLGLTVMGPHNYRYVPTWHPRVFPCLSDPSLPYLTETSARDLDFLFGDGFAAHLRALREAGEGLPERRRKGAPRGRAARGRRSRRQTTSRR